jgi:hypothetical protein
MKEVVSIHLPLQEQPSEGVMQKWKYLEDLAEAAFPANKIQLLNMGLSRRTVHREE